MLPDTRKKAVTEKRLALRAATLCSYTVNRVTLTNFDLLSCYFGGTLSLQLLPLIATLDHVGTLRSSNTERRRAFRSCGPGSVPRGRR